MAERARASAVLMRSPQPVARSAVKLSSASVASLIALRRWRRQGVKSAMGDNRNAKAIDELWRLALDAVVLGVAIVKVNEFEAEPGGTMGGLNDAFARFGSPVAASVIGLDILP